MAALVVAAGSGPCQFAVGFVRTRLVAQMNQLPAVAAAAHFERIVLYSAAEVDLQSAQKASSSWPRRGVSVPDY